MAAQRYKSKKNLQVKINLMSCPSNVDKNANSNASRVQSQNRGRGPELQYELYFPPNRCMAQDAALNPAQCPKYPYPLQNVPMCPSLYTPCTAAAANSDKGGNGPQNAPTPKDPQPSELYGDVLGMNEGTGSFYYHSPNPTRFDLSLTYTQPPNHYSRTPFA
jgi:hypothetical protein